MPSFGYNVASLSLRFLSALGSTFHTKQLAVTKARKLDILSKNSNFGVIDDCQSRNRFLRNIRENPERFFKWIFKLETTEKGTWVPNLFADAFKPFVIQLLKDMDEDTFLVPINQAKMARELGVDVTTIQKSWLPWLEANGVLDIRKGKPVYLYMVGVARYWEAYSNGKKIDEIPITRPTYRQRLKNKLSKRAKAAIQARCEWLKARGFSLPHITTLNPKGDCPSFTDNMNKNKPTAEAQAHLVEGSTESCCLPAEALRAY